MTQINKFGLHLQGTWDSNKKDSNEKFNPMMPEALATGCSWYTVLSGDLALVRWIKDHRPDAQIMIRDYDYDIMRHSPEARAEDVVRYMEPLIQSGFTSNITVGNELNLAIEHGDYDGQSQGYWTSPEGYMRIGEWTTRNTYRLRELLPEAIVWAQAFATGHREDGPDGDWFGYDYCREAIRMSHGICIHAYWPSPSDLDNLEARMWYSHRWARPKMYKGISDPGGAHAIFPDKWLFIKEHSSHPDTGNVIDFFNSLYGYPYVVGATAWLWRTPDPGHDAGRIQGRPLEGILRNTSKQLVELPDLSKPYGEIIPPNNEEEPHVPEFKYRFAERAARQDLGEPLEDMVYHYAGSENETVSQWTSKGLLIYVKKYDKDYFFEDSQPKNL